MSINQPACFLQKGAHDIYYQATLSLRNGALALINLRLDRYGSNIQTYPYENYTQYR